MGLGQHQVTRRRFLGAASAALPSTLLVNCSSDEPMYRLASFSADVTPPLGHGLLAGVIEPAREIVDPLFAHGVVLTGPEAPIVIVGADWCEIRNDAHERWRQRARRGGRHVARSRRRFHAAPTRHTGHGSGSAATARCPGAERASLRFRVPRTSLSTSVADALRASLPHARPVTHIGTGQARVDRVASNRRVETPDGEVSFNRSAVVPDPALRALPEGLIDPWLKTLSFWDGDEPIAAISCFAVHPITNYGQGLVSSDYVGLARQRMQQEHPSVAQVYLTGCAGDVTAGKYNDGNLANRAVLAEGVYQGMQAAWKATERVKLTQARFQSFPLELPLRSSPGFSRKEQEKEVADSSLPNKTRAVSAMGVSWWKRHDGGERLDIPVVDFGAARLLLCPGETFVQYQLWAQQMRPDQFVVAVGYGDSAPGYIPTKKASDEGFDRRRRSIKTWMWADPDRAESALLPTPCQGDGSGRRAGEAGDGTGVGPAGVTRSRRGFRLRASQAVLRHRRSTSDPEYLPEQHFVAGLHVHRGRLSVVEPLAGTRAHDLAALRLLLGGIGNDDAAFHLFAFFAAADYDTVTQGLQRHDWFSLLIAGPQACAPAGNRIRRLTMDRDGCQQGGCPGIGIGIGLSIPRDGAVGGAKVAGRVRSSC